MRAILKISGNIPLSYEKFTRNVKVGAISLAIFLKILTEIESMLVLESFSFLINFN